MTTQPATSQLEREVRFRMCVSQAEEHRARLGPEWESIFWPTTPHSLDAASVLSDLDRARVRVTELEHMTRNCIVRTGHEREDLEAHGSAVLCSTELVVQLYEQRVAAERSASDAIAYANSRVDRANAKAAQMTERALEIERDRARIVSLIARGEALKEPGPIIIEGADPLAFHAALAEVERLRGRLSDIAAQDCVYGDGCPAFGTNHEMCTPCFARSAITPQPTPEVMP